MFLAVHWLLAKSRVENLGTVDGSADDARTQFSLQPKLSALDVGLMERLLFAHVPRYKQASDFKFIIEAHIYKVLDIFIHMRFNLKIKNIFIIPC